MAFPADYTVLAKLSTVTAEIGSGTHSDYVALITEASFGAQKSNIFSNTDNGGGDVRYSLDEAGSSQIALDLVSWDTSGETCQCWVPRSVNSSTSVDIYVWGDNTGDSQPAASSTFGSEAVWSNFELVSHDGVSDATGNYTSTDVLPDGSRAFVANPFGKPDGAVEVTSAVNPNDNYIEFTSLSVSLASFALRCWGQTSTSGTQVRYASVGNSANATQINLSNNVTALPVDTAKATLVDNVNPSINILADVTKAQEIWSKLVITSNTTPSTAFYFDDRAGQTDTSTRAASIPVNNVRVGASSDSTPFGPKPVKVCEIWLETSEPTEEYLLTEYNNQSAPADFWTASAITGIDVTGSTTTYSYTSQNATVDFTGEVSVTGQTTTYSYASQNASINISGDINVTGQTTTYSYTAVNADVTLQGLISITGETTTYSYNALNGIVTISAGTIVNPKNIIRVAKKDTGIIVAHKSNIIRVN